MDAPIDAVLQHWPGVLFRQGADLKFRFIGNRIEEWTGQPVGKWMEQGGIFLGCIHENDAAAVREHLRRAEREPGPFTIRFRFYNAATGRVTHVSEFRRVIRDASGQIQMQEGWWQDETNTVRAEQRLESAAWTEMLSRITPGYAHDFNNAIAGVHGLSDAFLSQVEPDHAFHEGLGLMKRNTQQAAQMVQRLQQLHLPRTGERNYHDLNAVVKDTAEILRRGVSRSVELRTELAPEALPVYADLGRLQQTLLEMVFNATEAMNDRGRILIRATAHAERPALVHFAGTSGIGACVCLSVIDSGPGLTARQLTTLFTANATTKPDRRGVGLGLRHARKFAEAHGGVISVDSPPGAGATFQLWLPRATFNEAQPPAVLAFTRPRQVLLAGKAPEILGRIADSLRGEGVVAVVAGDEPMTFLADPDLAFDTLVVRVEAGDLQTAQLVHFARQHRLPLRIILQTAAGSEAGLESKLAAKADLILPDDLEADAVARRILAM
ncbi:MAG: two-component system, chemotaxis family, CheB/CheR fusion protein [Verrucomicrobiota bacterium]|jgi:signal transduction histidine kinase